jgi:hypothetical protein
MRCASKIPESLMANVANISPTMTSQRSVMWGRARHSSADSTAKNERPRRIYFTQSNRSDDNNH